MGGRERGAVGAAGLRWGRERYFQQKGSDADLSWPIAGKLHPQPRLYFISLWRRSFSLLIIVFPSLFPFSMSHLIHLKPFFRFFSIWQADVSSPFQHSPRPDPAHRSVALLFFLFLLRVVSWQKDSFHRAPRSRFSHLAIGFRTKVLLQIKLIFVPNCNSNRKSMRRGMPAEL